MKAPDISVILPVYNAEPYLRQSIDSILNQSFTNFELIIINDGSTDQSQQIIESYQDKRIIHVYQSNVGLAATLNRGIGMSQASIIARQDNDDISYTDRLEKQYKYLSINPDVVLLGTAARIIDEKGISTNRFHKHPSISPVLKFLLLFDNPFVHTSVMFRKSAFIQAGGYDTDVAYFEDFRLWSRFSKSGQLSNLQEVLVDYREVNTGMSKSAFDFDQKVINQSAQNIAELLSHYPFNEVMKLAKQSRGYGPFQNLKDDYDGFYKFLNELVIEFQKVHRLDRADLEPAVKQVKNQFLRAYYNTIINTADFSPLHKLMARIKRRIIIMQMAS